MERRARRCGRLAHAGPRTSERAKDKARRQAANAHFTVARLLLADHRPDEAVIALASASRFARSAGLVEPEAETQILSGQIALDRKEYGPAAAAFEQARAVLERRHATRLLVEANHGLTDAYDKLGKPDEALAAATRAIGLIEGMRGDLHDRRCVA
jgi:tetratricopeptide (TPR) repeat protein